MAESVSKAGQGLPPRRYLRRIPALAALNSQHLTRLQERFHRREYEAGETILRRGVHGGFVTTIESGELTITHETSGGHRSSITKGAGDYVVASTNHGDQSPSPQVCAATPVILWTLAQEEIDDLGRKVETASTSASLRTDSDRRSAPTASPLKAYKLRPALVVGVVVILALALVWVFFRLPQGKGFMGDLRYALGCWYLERGLSDAAFQEFQAALELNPALADSFNGLGYIYFQRGELDEAFAAFAQAARISSDSDVARNNLGLVRVRRGEVYRALESLQQAADLNGNIAQVYVNLGDVYLSVGDWLNASRNYREALRLDPDLAVTHHNLGATYYRLHELDDARSEFELAIQLDPDLPAAYAGLGVIAFEQDRITEALPAFQRAVELDPQDEIAYFYLGLIYKELGYHELAIDAFGHALGLSADPVVRQQAEWHLRELWGLP